MNIKPNQLTDISGVNVTVCNARKAKGLESVKMRIKGAQTRLPMPKKPAKFEVVNSATGVAMGPYANRADAERLMNSLNALPMNVRKNQFSIRRK